MSSYRLEFSQFRVKVSSEHPGGIVEGHASVFGNRDLQNEVVKQGAFKKTIADFKASRGKRLIPLMDSHKFHDGTDAVIGRVTHLEEDKNGLFFRAVFSETTKAQEIKKKLQEKILKKLSIGYRVIKDMMNRTTGVRELLELKLLEVSVVVFPANELAEVSLVKQAPSEALLRFRHLCNQVVSEHKRMTRNGSKPVDIAEFRKLLREINEIYGFSFEQRRVSRVSRIY